MRPAWLAYAFKREILRSQGVVILLLGIMLLLIPWILSMHYDFVAIDDRAPGEQIQVGSGGGSYSFFWYWQDARARTPGSYWPPRGLVFRAGSAGSSPFPYRRAFVCYWKPVDPSGDYCCAGTGTIALACPQWLPPSLLLAPLGLLVRKHARRLLHVNALGCCRSCGYDLRGTPERCPECGTPPAESIGMIGAQP